MAVDVCSERDDRPVDNLVGWRIVEKNPRCVHR